MLPKNEREALFDVDDRILMLERRLSNAKAAKDAFVHHLRGKYPNWTPPLPALSYQEGNFPVLTSSNPHTTPNYQINREPLLSRLSTGDYQWDVNEQRGNQNRMAIRRTPNYPSNFTTSPIDIPTSGPLLESDIRRSKIRLREISEELRSMRIDRMSLSTDQWLAEQPFRQRTVSLHFHPSDHHQTDHLEQARLHLSRLDLTETTPIDTPTEERKIDIQMTENHEKLLNEMRAESSSAVGVASVAPPTQAPPPRVVQWELPQQQVAQVQAPPPPVVQAPPPQVAPPPPVVQAPPPVTGGVSDLFKNMDLDTDSDDTPRQAPPPQQPQQTVDYGQLLKTIGSMAGGDSSSDEGDANPRPSFGISRPPVRQQQQKSLMFRDDEESDIDEFFH
ncbi:hypothetical protein GCK72_021576 [Caenorhabditis remanei]|uniref:Uncharacterized protein n=1 Tax=Caenorhabditis remanei TaxID=31234 RepID=A0A6A5GKZ5_CAERE|nr:hypothetical protein GCK72_021576 [Caenorhabditis remanei]KAF1755009.1 hypothetical protein GCK72_021576 [Caenorhabditis remanei]